jgi:Co/Zn/Cd efflux system component
MTPSIPTETPYIPDDDDDDSQLQQCDDFEVQECDYLQLQRDGDLQLQQGDDLLLEQYHQRDGPNGEELAVTAETHIPSNERILGFAFWTFLIFTLTQIAFAFIAGSHAMIGDSVAMLVDSVTYLFNYFAERKKHQFDAAAALREDDDSDDPIQAERICKRNRRKMVLELEILTPTISVTALMTLTMVVMTQAIQLLLQDLHRSASEQQVPNIKIMLAFSLSNLVLDFLNIFCFARAKHLMGYSTKVKGETSWDESHREQMSTNADSGKLAISVEDVTAARMQQQSMRSDARETMSSTDSNYVAIVHSDHSENANDPSEHMIDSRSNQRPVDSHQPRGHHEDDETNLNMCSAYTHVFADTLRSVAVLVAAVVALLGPNVTPEVADSFASVVVSLLILFSLVPLIHGLIRSVSELRVILKEERLEISDP